MTKDQRIAWLDRYHVSPAGRAYRFLTIIIRCNAIIRGIV